MQAWMTIGAASNLETCRSLVASTHSYHDTSLEGQLDLGCKWSVHILESLYVSGTSPKPPLPNVHHPRGAPIPPQATTLGEKEDCPADLYNPYKAPDDCGITGYFLQMSSLYARLSTWLRLVRTAKEEDPASPGSGYAKLVADLYAQDSRLHANHLLRNVCFSKRSRKEIERHREYWIPWVQMQVAFHSYLAILNHPFIHLVAVRKWLKKPSSGLFLQSTVDAALFNAGWALHFLQKSDEYRLELYNPFLGNLVAMLATIPWLFQFVGDDSISQKSARDFEWCMEYLNKSAELWPHLQQKVSAMSPHTTRLTCPVPLNQLQGF